MQEESFARLVKTMREEKGLSLEEVRRRSGSALSTSYVNRIENGAVPPSVISIGTLTKLAKGLGEPIHKLFNLAIRYESELNEDTERLRYLTENLIALRVRDLVMIGNQMLEDQDVIIRLVEDGKSDELLKINPGTQKPSSIGIAMSPNSEQLIPTKLDEEFTQDKRRALKR